MITIHYNNNDNNTTNYNKNHNHNDDCYDKSCNYDNFH